MKHPEQWQPTKVLRDARTGLFAPNKTGVYSGSMHTAEVQMRAYLPLFETYCRGKLLDAGCHRVPWYEVYKPYVDAVYCIDRSEQPEVLLHLDEQVDLNTSFQLKERDFDTVLLTDVFAHLAEPDLLFQSIHAHLKKGGHLILTTPFVYWISEHPHEYYHPTASALEHLCKKHGMEVKHLESYGGYGDVFLDTINKGMAGRWTYRVFRIISSLVKSSGWYKRVNAKTKYSYPLGYTLVATKA